ncbi:MAG: two-component regulator propeller domain-containing protein [Spirosomataceae bacterium]
MCSRLPVYLLLLCSFLKHYGAFGQLQAISFQQLGPEHGLPIHYATGIVQDTSGFIWIGTLAGITRFDGIRCKTFTHNREDPHSLSATLVRAVLLSKNGTLWVGTQHGFNRFDFKSQRFKRFHFTNYSERTDYIRCIAEDNRGKLWLGTADGVLIFDPITEQTELLKLPTDASSKASVYSIRSILADGDCVWIGTDLGLYRYYFKRQSFQVFCKSDELGCIPDNTVSALVKHPTTGNLIVGSRNGILSTLNLQTEHFLKIDITIQEAREISSLFFDKNGQFWVSTLGDGIFCYSEFQQGFTQYLSDIYNPNSLSSNHVKTIFQDRSGVLWFTTSYKGISRFNPQNQSFEYPLKKTTFKPSSANGAVVNRIAFDSQNNLWLATDGGVVWVDQKTHQHRIYQHDPNNPNSLADNSIKTVYVDEQDHVWIGTQSSFHHFNPFTQQIERFEHLPNETTPSPDSHIPRFDFIAGKNVYDINVTGDGRLYIGTDEGLNIYDPRTKKIINRFNHELIRKYIPTNRYNSFFLDSKRNLWVGCGVDEVLCISPDLLKVKRYQYQENNPRSLPNNGVMSFAEDAKGNIWMGTDHGLGCLDIKTQLFTNYSTDDGLVNNYVSALISERNNIWMGTANGLTRYDANRKRFTSFGRADNLEMLSIETKGVAKDKFGYLYFGGLYGLVKFHPTRVKTNAFVPPVVVTSLKVYGKEKLPTLNHVSNEPIHLDYDQNDLVFEAAALSYDHSENNLYSFWLQGSQDKEWTVPSVQSTLNYLNVPPGDYVLHVKAANNDGVWNPVPYRLPIIIYPPFWQTLWFRFLVISAIAGLGVYFYRMRVKIIEQEHATEVNLLEEQRTLQKQLNKELTEKLDYQQKFEAAQKQQAETERKAILLEREQVLSRYQNLVNQLNPHFLFNSLAVLDSLIYKDHKLASKYLRQLTKVYRYLIENDEQETVSLEQELRFAQDFVSLLQMRYSDGLLVQMDIPATLHQKRIVPVTFQNLIENAIKHNITAAESHYAL